MMKFITQGGKVMKSRIMTHRVFLINPKKLIIILLIVFSLDFFIVQQKIIRQTKATGNAFYMATNGNDFKPGTESRPWKTIQRASNKMIAGGTTYVREGTYDRNSGISETSSLIPAFPGAEGFGANSVGGRGGRVIEVTNLNDSGSGSLRACIEASGPRICVFRTGGTIELQSTLTITNPHITIAGQTAPGGGIALKVAGSFKFDCLVVNETHDVIIRYIRSRPGPSDQLTCCRDALTIRKAYNVIIDHCSISWGVDENGGTWYDTHDVTIQWSIISEALYDSSHYKGPRSYGLLLGSEGSEKISIHHNLFAHNNQRNPLVATAGVVDIVNNTIYNFGQIASAVHGSRGLVPANYVGNFVKRGPNSSLSKYGIDDFDRNSVSIYLQGNVGPYRPDESYPEENIIEPSGRQYITSTWHNAIPVMITSAFEAYDQVLANAGATIGLDSQGNSYWRRDTVDERIVNDVINGTGRIIDDPSEVGGWPYLSPGTPYTDSDHDGMADDWELAHFGALDRGSPDDSSSDFDGDGYTDLEEYLNGTNPKEDNIPTQIFLPFVSKGNLP
jgi:pectate lyase